MNRTVSCLLVIEALKLLLGLDEILIGGLPEPFLRQVKVSIYTFAVSRVGGCDPVRQEAIWRNAKIENEK